MCPYTENVFNDIFGQVIRELNLETGYGVLNINTSELPNGVYHYSLVVNGNIVDSKKMVRNK